MKRVFESGKFYRLKAPLTVYKKALDYFDGDIIVTLRIPRGALMFVGDSRKCRRLVPSGFGYKYERVFVTKCRASSAVVLRLSRGKVAYSYRDVLFRYVKGKRLRPRDAFDRAPDTCASGIHFFMTRREAEAYDFS